MKFRLSAAVIAGSLLLTGCSASNTTPGAEPSVEASVPTAATFEPGVIVAQELGKECEPSQEPPADFISFMGDCEGYDTVEFNTSIYGTTMDKAEALEQLSEMYINAGRGGGSWIVSDNWAINTQSEETIKKFLEEDSSLGVMTWSGEPRFLSDQIEAVKAAMKEVTGIDCKDKGKIDGTEITAIGCKKDGEYYAILGFFADISTLESAMLEPKEMFQFAKRDTFIVNGSSWLIYDVPQSDAHQLQAILGGTVENLGEPN